MDGIDVRGGRARSLLGQLSAFYFPLAIQGISMSLTYPLVGSVVAHGHALGFEPGAGPTEYSIFAQSQAIMFLVGSIGNGLISTGMIFAVTKRGLRNFTILSLSLGLGAALLQMLCTLPPLDGLVFGKLYHLDGDYFQLAKNILLFSIPMNFAFFVRNSGLATLFREKRTDKATLATFFRIILTLVGSRILVHFNLVGWQWGLALTSTNIILETTLMNVFALPYQRRLEEDDGGSASIWRQYAFTIPLSLGGMMLCISGTMIPVFLALTPCPEIARNVHYISFGILNTLSAAAAKMQSVSIAFPPKDCKPAHVFTFSVAIGAILSAVSFVLQIPSVANWYFGTIQNLPPEHIPLAMRTMLVIGVIPLVISAKSYSEGVAAIRMRPSSILADQIGYLATLLLVFFIMVHTAPIAGYLMSGVSMLTAQIVSLIVIRIALFSNRIADDYGVSAPSRESH